MRRVLVAGGLLLLGCGATSNGPAAGAGNAGEQNLGGSGAGGGAQGGSSAGSTDGGTATGAVAGESCGEAPRVAGSKLVPRVLVEEDGATIPYDLFNAEMGDSCYLSTDPEGNPYCGISPSAGACVPPTFTSVPLERELVGDDAGLALITYTSADGARFALGSFYDRERDVDLNLVASEDAQAARLLPQGSNPLTWYGSAPMDCSQATPSPRDFVAIDGCGVRSDTRFVSVGEVLTPGEPPVHRLFSTEPIEALAYWCFGTEGGPMLMSETMSLLRATEVTIDTWNRGTRMRAGTGRYRYDAWQVGCHIVTWGRPDVLYDTLRDDERCSFLDDGSGMARCTPTYHDIAMVAYLDPQCTQPVAANDRTPEPMKRYARENAAVVAEAPLYEVGAMISSGTAVYINDSEPCVPYHQGVGLDVYELASIVSPEEFGLLRVDAAP